MTSARDPVSGQAHSYTYTPLNMLSGDQAISGTTSSATTWTPNAAYEITQIGGNGPATPYSTTLSYDPAHELTGLTALSGTTPLQTVTYTDNADGDRTGQTDSVSSARTTFTWDQADRLTAAALSGTAGLTQARYLYDGDGLRQSVTLTTTQDTTTTPAVWDTSGNLPLLLQDGGRRFVTGPNGLPLEQVTADGSVQYYLQDAGAARAACSTAAAASSAPTATTPTAT